MFETAPLKMITDATLVLPDGQLADKTLLIQGARIQAITDQPPASLLLNQENVEVISAAGCYVSPGLIELHFNGALGCNLSQTTISEVRALLQKLPAFGITSALLTIITASLTDTLSAIHTLEEVVHYKKPDRCRPLGLHLEGPFISPEFPGVHSRHDIRPVDLQELSLLLSPQVKMMTLAPEMDPTGQAIAKLREHGVRVSLGHTSATVSQAQDAVEYGACGITHLYNAMRPFHHREPGIIAVALSDDRLTVQVIGDGVHVHPEAIKMILRAKHPRQILLTSDASPLAGLPDGTTGLLGKEPIAIHDGAVRTPEGTLAGSSQLVYDCVRNFVAWGLTGFADAIQFASSNPADYLGLNDLGKLEPGRLADLVFWNKKSLTVESTFIHGQKIYQH